MATVHRFEPTPALRWREAVFARLYAPLFWAGFIGAAAWWLGTRQGSPLLLLPLLLLAIAVSLLAECYLPYWPLWNRDAGDSGRDIAHAVVNESLNLLGLAALPLLAGALPDIGLWPHRAPFALQLLGAIVLADCGLTLMHWASHRFRPLWRLHAVHHSVRRMYGFNGLMKHPLHQMLEAAAGVAPLLLLGMPAPVAAGLAFAIAIQLLLQHSNVDMRLGPLRHVFAWAPLHRFHHIKYGTAGDVNFGLFFTVWDRLLGTAFDNPRYRIDSEDLGIGSWPDYPSEYRDQLLEPFFDRPAQALPPIPPGLPQPRAKLKADDATRAAPAKD
ncbi:sterol desaturase family protein [Pseudomonas sp. CGJS7]|uniref:sterol desaturase family protein n=1 Tax=Pseudomonas sp. CGJS7 TaxID=3109348 RepID=UPI00300B97B1